MAGGLSQILATTSGGTTSTYLDGTGADRLAALTGSVRTWYGSDNQGSVRQTLNDTGGVLSTQNYDPYGTSEGTLSTAFGYTGELQDAMTGAVNLRARWYQPGTGTLLGVDPEVDATGQAYAYAGGNPVNGSDPTGLSTITHSDPYGPSGSYVQLGVVSGDAQPGSVCGAQSAQSGLTVSYAVAARNLNPRPQYMYELPPGAYGQSSRDSIPMGTGHTYNGNIIRYDDDCWLGSDEPDELMLPIGPGEPACHGGTGLQQGESLVIVDFGELAGGDHSMVFTTDGIGNFWKWEGVCRTRTGHRDCDGVRSTGQLYFQETHESEAQLRSDQPGLDNHDSLGFYHRIRTPVQANNALIRTLGRRLNARNLEYLIWRRNCHTFTHAALNALGLHAPDESWVHGRGWYDHTL